MRSDGPPSRKQSHRWTWIVGVLLVLATGFFICFGPYLTRMAEIRNVSRRHVRFTWTVPTSRFAGLYKLIRRIPGFYYYGMEIARAEIYYNWPDRAGLQPGMLPGIVRDLRRLDMPVEANLSRSPDLERDLELLASTRVVELHIRDRKVSPKGLKLIGSMPELRRLRLQECEFDNASLVHLSHLDHLEELILDDSSIDSAGMQHLRGLKSLNSISLSNTRVTEEAKSELGAALPSLNLTDD